MKRTHEARDEHSAAVSGGEVQDARVKAAHRSIPPVAEALGYVGGALALAAAAVLLSNYWGAIGLAGHLAVGVALAAAGLVGGFVLARRPGEAVQRLAHFLLLAGTAGVGFAAGFLVRDVLVATGGGASASTAILANGAEWGWFAGAAAFAITAGVVWWLETDWLQHVAFGVGVAAAVLLALPLFPAGGQMWAVGATLVAVSLAWGALSLRGLLPPKGVGEWLAALGVFVGLEMMVLIVEGPTPLWALWLGAVGCALLVWGGAQIKQYGVLGIGAVGLTVFCGQLIGEYMGFGAGTAIALIVVGLLVVGVGVRLVLTLAAEASRGRRVTAEVVSYLGIALAMGGAGILLVNSWDALGMVGRILVPALGAAVAYGGALVLERSDTSIARRLSQVLYGIGVVAIGVTAADVARPLLEPALSSPDSLGYVPLGSVINVIGGLAAAIAGGLTWWFRKGAITQIAFMGGILMTLMPMLDYVDAHQLIPMWILPAIMVAVGLVWVVLGILDRMTPARTALTMGCVAMFIGFQGMTRGGPEGRLLLWASALAIVAGIAAIVASVYLKRAILLAFGAIMIATFSALTVMDLFAGTVGAPILLLAIGLVLVVIAVVVGVLAPRMMHTPKEPKLPAGPGAPVAHA